MIDTRKAGIKILRVQPLIPATLNWHLVAPMVAKEATKEKAETYVNTLEISESERGAILKGISSSGNAIWKK